MCNNKYYIQSYTHIQPLIWFLSFWWLCFEENRLLDINSPGNARGLLVYILHAGLQVTTRSTLFISRTTLFNIALLINCFFTRITINQMNAQREEAVVRPKVGCDKSYFNSIPQMMDSEFFRINSFNDFLKKKKSSLVIHIVNYGAHLH